MPLDSTMLLERFHEVLVEEIRTQRPDLLSTSFTIAEIYQELVPYRTHRDRLGVEMNGDYEHLLLRLLAGEGDYLILEADAPRKAIKAEFESPNPNTGLYREWAAADVRLNPEKIPGGEGFDGAAMELDLGEEAGAAVPVVSLAPSEEAVGNTAEQGSGSERDDSASAALAAEQLDGLQLEEAWVTEEDARNGGPATCNWCRAELPSRENLNYCPFCGTDVNVVPCPSCGEALEPDWRFCIACGAEVVKS
jgi:Double zinc ribbon